MKIALAIHGNLRTFLMPLRENPSLRLCDIFLQNIIIPNLSNIDIFISTDCNDFYYDDFQYFCDDKKIEITNGNSFRLYPKIKFDSKKNCKDIIYKELNKILPNIKNISINDPENFENDEKTIILKKAIEKGRRGAVPTQIVSQYKKLKTLYNDIENYENKFNVKYDAILKIRFDLLYPHHNPLILNSLDIDEKTIYVPGCQGNLVYDWLAYGKKEILKKYFNLYDNLGFTLEYPCWLVENCFQCGKTGIYGDMPCNTGWTDKCPNCKNSGNIWAADITISSEYHIFKLYDLMNVKIKNINYMPLVYRYLDLNTSVNVDDILKNNNMKNVKFVSKTEIGQSELIL